MPSVKRRVDVRLDPMRWKILEELSARTGQPMSEIVRGQIDWPALEKELEEVREDPQEEGAAPRLQ